MARRFKTPGAATTSEPTVEDVKTPEANQTVEHQPADTTTPEQTAAESTTSEPTVDIDYSVLFEVLNFQLNIAPKLTPSVPSQKLQLGKVCKIRLLIKLDKIGVK